MRTVGWLAVAAFSVLVILKGLMPAFATIGTDFANYYVSSYVLVHEPQDSHKLYDAEWFSRRAQSLGGPVGAIFQPFPPPTALLMAPLVFFDIRTAKSIWIVVNIGIAAALVLILSRLSSLSYSQSLLVVLGSGWALINTLALGQVYLLMTLCLALSVLLYKRQREFASGVVAGIFIPIKYFPLALVVVFLVERKWNAAVGAALSAFAVLILSVLMLGPDVHRTFLDSVLWHHLDGEMSNPFSATYQSWDSLLRSLFVKDQILNPNPLFDYPPGFFIARAVVILSLVYVLVLAMRRRFNHESHTTFYISVFFAFALLIAPATATYHFLVLAIPVAMLTPMLLERHLDVLVALILLYSGIGLVPAGAADRLGLEGGWKLLGYPRLYFLLAFFLMITQAVDRRTKTNVSLSTSM